MKFTFWPYTVDTYDLFRVVLENPRIPKNRISSHFKVKNPKTGESWFNAAVRKQIIGVPIFRRFAFENFREHVYFVKTDYPDRLYEELKKESADLMYFCVQTGPSNFQIISTKEIDPRGEVVLSGVRSDYYVTVPPRSSPETSVSAILRKAERACESVRASPLVRREGAYEKWDKGMEAIYRALRNDMRKPFLQVINEVGTYSDKIMKWMRSRHEFGQTIVTYFPLGVASYRLVTFLIETECDSLFIDLFSSFPASTVFYRVEDHLIMAVYLPYTLEGRSIVHKVLSILGKKELVGKYTNSVSEYHYSV